ncbi:hypothetical protein [Maritimibacter sp. UBA3975]|uniref:hypothetical protein n=1 Tax=Maritimibacter sp. UBA3975 TaxID=1946833 RepID=UPI000C0ACF4E|nr:hypothetical protein [Maritimibacter sp. UBA3975]MAM60933.1 hypothetical protein [Maritimibacter sp.]
MAATTPQNALAKGAWECGFEDVRAVEEVRAQREATLSQRYFVTDEGRVEVVRIVVEPPRRWPFLDLLALDLKRRLGITTGEGFVGRFLGVEGRVEQATADINTELRDWELSPVKRVRHSPSRRC